MEVESELIAISISTVASGTVSGQCRCGLLLELLSL